MFSNFADSTFKESWFKNRKRLLVLVIIGITAVWLVINISLQNGKIENPEGLAPDFSLVDIDGRNFTLSDYLGKVVVLNFMTISCPTCVSEIQELESVWANYNETIIMASVDVSPYETDEHIRAFRASYPEATWSWIRDTANVAEMYGVYAVPKTVIIDENGVISFTHLDAVSAQTLVDEIQQLLK